jgi:hypothetical protein
MTMTTPPLPLMMGGPPPVHKPGNPQNNLTAAARQNDLSARIKFLAPNGAYEGTPAVRASEPVSRRAEVRVYKLVTLLEHAGKESV